VCTVCQRVSPDGNLWCQEPDCPAGDFPAILDYGEWLGDIEVVRLLRVLRTAALYEARRGDEFVLLKVAHNGCQDQLRREARVLAEQGRGRGHPMLPELLPAYAQSDLKQRAYGKVVFRDETKYYVVFRHLQGEFLRDLLQKNPQPWYQHAAWITVSLADAVAFLHLKARRLHLNLNPDAVLVRLDRDGIPRPVLLDLGFAAEPGEIDPAWARRYAAPAYLPPEVLAGGAPTHAADVYGLGLLAYEMLAGRPAFRFDQRRDEAVRRAVAAGEIEPLQRTDLAGDIHAIIQQATDRLPERRQQDVRAFAKQLRTKFGEVPAEHKRSINRRLAAAVVALALLMVVLILVAALLG